MDCVVCNKTGATYRLVDGRTAGVCEQCVAEHLTGDIDNEKCLYCGTEGDYDLAEYTGPVTEAGDESPAEYESVTDGVVCRRHFDDLVGEGA